MRNNGECCANCTYCKYQSGDYICTNDMSDAYADYVDYNFCCDEFEGKDD